MLTRAMAASIYTKAKIFERSNPNLALSYLGLILNKQKNRHEFSWLEAEKLRSKILELRSEIKISKLLEYKGSWVQRNQEIQVKAQNKTKNNSTDQESTFITQSVELRYQ